MKFENVIIGLCAAFTLSACGGSEGGASFDQLISRSGQALVDIEAGGYNYLIAAPAQSRASMDGIALIGVNGHTASDEIILGKMTMDVNFSGGSASGTINEFALYDVAATLTHEQDLGGSVTYAADVDMANAIFAAPIDGSGSGTMQIPGGSTANVEFGIGGDFYEVSSGLSSYGGIEGVATVGGSGNVLVGQYVVSE
ncbi:hypothetical protein [Celeribacter arenosi]|uniref:Transferrin-binding protein B C-lobe/N-lobe beta barrel domain-containing protein n=1 Tax=Celeribacter arenosi TaxID=792649 RepID=A0ABP7KCI0_9RHOB